MRPSRARNAVSVLALCALGGCGALGPMSNQKPPPPDQQEGKSSGVRTDRPASASLMSELPRGPARQAELFQSAKDRPRSPLPPLTGSSMPSPWRPRAIAGSDPVAAQRQLSELLARPETLLPDERLLALVELQRWTRGWSCRPRTSGCATKPRRIPSEKLQAANRRLQAESDENARLRKAWTRLVPSSTRSRTSSGPSPNARPPSRTRRITVATGRMQ